MTGHLHCGSNLDSQCIKQDCENSEERRRPRTFVRLDYLEPYRPLPSSTRKQNTRMPSAISFQAAFSTVSSQNTKLQRKYLWQVSPRKGMPRVFFTKQVSKRPAPHGYIPYSVPLIRVTARGPRPPYGHFKVMTNVSCPQNLSNYFFPDFAILSCNLYYSVA